MAVKCLNWRGWPGFISMSGVTVLSFSSAGRIGIFVTQLSVSLSLSRSLVFFVNYFCFIKFYVIFVVCHVDDSYNLLFDNEASFCFKL